MAYRLRHLNYAAADGGVRRGPRSQSPLAAADGGVRRGPRFQPPHGSPAVFPHGVFNQETVAPHSHQVSVAAAGGGVRRGPRFQPPRVSPAVFPHEVSVQEIRVYPLHHLINFPTATVDGGVRRGPRFQPPRGYPAVFPHEASVQEIRVYPLHHLINFATANVDGGVRRGPSFQPPHGPAAVLPHEVFVLAPPPVPSGPSPSQSSQNMFNGRHPTYQHQNNTQDLMRSPSRDGGLSEEVIARSLKTRTSHEPTTTDEEDSKICVVCQDDLCQENQTIGILNCGHEYHASCIKQWLQQKNICPLCKAVAL